MLQKDVHTTFGGTIAQHEPALDPSLASLIERVPEVLIDRQGGAQVYCHELYAQIAERTDAVERIAAYKAVARKACEVALSSFDEKRQMNARGSALGLQGAPGGASCEVSFACGQLEKIVADVWLQLYLEGACGADLFDSYFLLVEKLKKESIRLQMKNDALYGRPIEQIERLYNLFYLDDRRHSPAVEDRASVERRFQEIVGRPISSREEYFSKHRRSREQGSLGIVK